MKLLPLHKRKFVVFKRWSRKAYASFVSLKCEVKIGILSVSITNTLGSKTKKLLVVFQLFLKTAVLDILKEEIISFYEASKSAIAQNKNIDSTYSYIVN